MRREELADLNAFMAIAEEASFTRAAAKLGTSQSNLSYTMRRLEARLGVRLLSRTTRQVALTEAGERLLQTLSPALASIEDELASLSQYRDKPAGRLRITASEHAAQSVLLPALARLLPEYPDLHIEIVVDAGLTDIVAERFDAGIRLGDAIAKDMIALRVGPDLRMAVVAAPTYFAQRRRPKTPKDLADHRCINLRMRSSGGIYGWELQKGRRELHVRVDGQLVVNDASTIVQAVESGLGLACLPENLVESAIAAGRLIRVLDDWCPAFPGYHLYYPSRRQSSAAFRLLLDALRYPSIQ